MSFSIFKGSKPAQDATERLDKASPDASLRSIFAGCDDETWLWALTEGRETDERLRAKLPTLPEDRLQKQFTGRADRATFEQAIAATGLFLHEARALGLDTARPDLRVLDVGCGWGRITQTLLREFEPTNITGCDVMPEALDICRSTGLDSKIGVELVQTPYMPPSGIEPGTQDLIVAYSVFSHLAEAPHMAWVEEFARLLSPGGVLVVTTRARMFIDYTESVRQMPDLPEHARGTASAFKDADRWHQRYDAGEFCFDGMSRGGGCPEDYYGEALVPEGYAQREWTRFLEDVRFMPAEKHGLFDQSIIAARKPG